MALLLSLGVAAAVLPAPAWGQTAAPAPPAPAPPTDLSRLVAAVERLVHVLEEQAQEKNESREIERLQVLVSIMSIRSRKVESLESDLRELDAQEQSSHMELTQMKAQIEQLDAPDAAGPASDSPGPENKAVRRLIQSREKDLEDQLAKLEERRVQTQNELAAARRRLAQLESTLEEWIDRQTSGKP